MNKGYRPIEIANYFLALSKNGLSLMQLLKLSYIAHGFKMALLGEDHPLSNELVQAWKFGPVFPSLYHQFKYKPPGKIRDQATVFDEATDSLKIAHGQFNDKETKIMDLVFDIYGDLDGWQLSELTHKEGTPWHTVWNERGQYFHGVTIPNEDIANHFKNEIIDNRTS